MIRILLGSKKYLVLAALLVLCAGGILAWEVNKITQTYGTDAGPALAQALDACGWKKRDNDYYACLRKEIKPVVQNFGVQKTISAVREFYQQQVSLEESARNVVCHEEAHIISEVGIDVAENPEQVFAACTPICGYGCHHGAASALFRKKGDILEDLSTICGAIRRKGSSFPGQDGTACYHGIGHGLADFAGRDIVKALTLCNEVEDIQGKDECATGVFMELFDAPTFNQKHLPLPDDFIGFCKGLPVAKDVCMRSAGGYEFRRSQDGARAFAVCRSAPSDISRSCAVGIGSDFHFLFEGNADKGVSACMAGKELTAPCIQGLIISGFVSDRSGSIGIHYCQEVSQSDLQTSCFQYLGKSAEQLGGPDEHERVCADAGSGIAACRGRSRP